MTVLERLAARTIVSASYCFILSGADSERYRAISVNGKRHAAHRLAYELLIGPIPDGMELDHLCKTTACWNPEHLEPVTHKENIHRSWPTGPKKFLIYCRNNHKRTDTNTVMRGCKKVCLECERAKSIRYRKRR